MEKRQAMEIAKKLAGWLRGQKQASQASTIAVVAGVPLADDSPLVRQTAERLRQRQLQAGGWAAEAGGLPLEAFVPEARKLVQRVALGMSEGGPPAP
jgi:hypothetical protein